MTVNPNIIWPSTAAIFALAEPLIRKWEGLRLTAYLCPASKWTIGFGTTRYPNGKAVQPGDTCTVDEALVYLEFSMRKVLQDMQSDGAITRSPTVRQAAAFLCLAYNVGLGIHDGKKGDLADSSLFAAFNVGQIASAGQHFLDWDKAHVNGVITVLPGLEDRRRDEMALFLSVPTNANQQYGAAA